MGRTFIIVTLITLNAFISLSQPSRKHDLHFSTLSKVWDEGIPLGNAVLGALIWEKDGELRFSLDRSDLWDLRPMKGLHGPEFRYKWIYEQVKKKEYGVVQKHFDEPYEREAAPSKIPGAALQFDTKRWGDVSSVHLNIATAVCTIKWKSGIVLETFVHAQDAAGWFRISNFPDSLNIRIVPPAYSSNVRSGAGSIDGDDLNRLGYSQGQVTRKGNDLTYLQEGWGGFKYEVAASYRYSGKNALEGVWSISAHYPDKPTPKASDVVKNTFPGNYKTHLATHLKWWKEFWSKSSVRVPADNLEKQWYLELYKFGSAARENAPPISLQAVWTADNGRLPPWKGDYHHDLNTQLSYWPSYSANHLQEGMGYYNHLDSNRKNYINYTRTFFEKDGLNVPGVTTLEGKEMGGWIQYSGSPTISAWLAHNYYLQWRYSMDRTFLKERAYPWISQSAKFIENITELNADGFRQLPISSSPEIFNNNLEAWFLDNTNYDLSLMKFVVGAAAELAEELGNSAEAAHWKSVLSQFEPYHLTADKVMMFAPTKPYDESHRHFSHTMAIHPLGLIKWEDGDSARTIIRNSIKSLDDVGPGLWTGYSYSWLANLKARAKDGEGAAKALDIFARAFCLSNSFHVNGDQTKSGLSTFVYRPFTLEGNFAFASGLQEMLLQSYAGFIEVFPAVPATWKDVSFTTLRTEGAYLVSAEKKDGIIKRVTIASEKQGLARLKLPFKNWKVASQKNADKPQVKEELMEINFSGAGNIVLENTMH